MFVELHVNSLKPEVIHLMTKLGYSALATLRMPLNTYEIPIFTKLVITQGSSWKIRLASKYDLISVVPWSRFVLNKLISDDRIDIITINSLSRDVIPSKAQAKAMAREGKALEIVVNPIIATGERGLLFLRDLLIEYLHIDGLRIVVSQGIGSVYDVRNPMDVVALLSTLTGNSMSDLSPLVSDVPYNVIADSMYRKGICVMHNG